MQNIGSTRKYLFIDSSFRDRNKYPLQSNFVIPYKGNLSLDTVNDQVFPQYPVDFGILVNNLNVGDTTIRLSGLQQAVFNNQYVGYILNAAGLYDPDYNDLAKQNFTITGFDVDTSTFTISPPSTIRISVLTTPFIYIHKEPPLLWNQPMVVNVSNPSYSKVYIYPSTIQQLPTGILGKYLVFKGTNASYNTKTNVNNNGNLISPISRVIDFDEKTNEATITPQLLEEQYYEIADTVDIVDKIVDNEQPLYFNGKSENRQLYDVELVSLALPQSILVYNYPGGSVALLPYLAVTIANKVNVAKNIIASNASSTETATFVVPITDITNATNTSSASFYVRLSRSFQKQRINFSFTEDVVFEITTPSGEPLIFQADQGTPRGPTPFIQLYANFEFTPIDRDVTFNYQDLVDEDRNNILRVRSLIE